MARSRQIDLDKMLDHIFVRMMGAGSAVVGGIGVVGGLLVLIVTAFGTRERALWIAGSVLVVVGVLFLVVARLSFRSYLRDLERRQVAARERRERRKLI
ncbi:hypothetical protein [Leekyejoonella antrihumi]|uniref:hypothetical protein n=1 Tax=Leekyejoonella antrihumi TaxID=1660198 RepID=UPI001FE91C68|nr:hypothetical protein [Leekyejoonella antrihumi]